MEGILRAAPTLMRVLRIIRDLELPDGLVMSARSTSRSGITSPDGIPSTG